MPYSSTMRSMAAQPAQSGARSAGGVVSRTAPNSALTASRKSFETSAVASSA
jgi:hypothetical protein